MQATEPRRLVLAAVPLVVAQSALLVLWDPMRSGWAFLAIMAFAFSALLWACRSLRGTAPTAVQLLAVAALLRIIALPMPPSLSDDIYRYVWDGRVVLAGYNPYAHAPDSESLVHLRDEIWENTAHKGVETVYPPVAQGLFSIAASTPFPRLMLKLMLAGIDLAGCLLLLHLVRLRQGSRVAGVAYVWNPLVVLEGAGMGHIDVVGASACVAVVVLLLGTQRGSAGTYTDGRENRRRIVSAALMAVVGVLTKLVPLVALANWQRVSRDRVFGLVVLGCLLAICVPIGLAVGGVPPGLVKYGVSWEFNGPLFEPLYRLLEQLGVVPALKAGIEWLKQSTGIYEPIDVVYPYVYAQFLAKLILAAGICGLILASLRQVDVLTGTSKLMRWVLVFSATLYPWYLIWALPWSAIGGHRAWLVLAASMQFAYLPRLFAVEYFPWVYLAVWTPFVGVLAVEAWFKRRSNLRGEPDGGGGV